MPNHHKYISFFSSAPLLAILVGCAAPRDIPPGSTMSLAASERLVIAGVTAGAIIIAPGGEVKDGKFFASASHVSGVAGLSENGWIVQRLQSSPDNIIGLTTIMKDKKVFLRNCGEKSFLFRLKPNAINYIGHFELTTANGKLDMKLVNNIEAARRHLNANYNTAGLEITLARPEEIEQGTCNYYFKRSSPQPTPPTQ
jgi:hypothetical protein